MAHDYDVIVIGAGPVGENLADRARQGDLSVAVVESDLVGGECSYWACIPSKALLRPVAALRAARQVAGAAQATTGTLDREAAFARRDGFTHEWHDDSQVEWLDGAGIDLVRGHGRLSGERRVTVTAQDGAVRTLTARHAVALCTGSVANLPDSIAGLADAGVWTSREATSAHRVPGHLAVIGGGVVAAEMATLYAALGARVTMLVTGERLLAGVEPFAGEAVAAALTERGAELRFGTAVEAVRRLADGRVEVRAGGGVTVTADEALAAVGRAPSTADLGLEAVGLQPGSWLDVDETLRVRGVEGGWLYAAGDVNHRVLLTHMGKYQARAAGDAIAARARGELDGGTPPAWSRYRDDADDVAVPQVIFTEPEVAAVGLTERAARERGLPVRAVDYDLGAVAGSSLYADGFTGRARLVVDTEREVVVGFTAVGPDVGELVHAATIAVVGEVPMDRLWHAVPSFPTMSEVWLRLLEAWGRSSRTWLHSSA